MTGFSRRAMLGAAAAAALPLPALAQAPWSPTRPVRLLVGFPPGGAADILARRLAEAISPALGERRLNSQIRDIPGRESASLKGRS